MRQGSGFADRSKQKPASAPASQARGLGDWVGAGTVGKVFKNTTFETFVDDGTDDGTDGGTKDSLEIRIRWTLAELASAELSTDAVMEVDRTIHIQLTRGASLLIRSRARSWFYADQLPNDVYAALHAPAERLEHAGSIFVADDRGLHLLRTYLPFSGKAQTMKLMLAGEPMLGFIVPPEEILHEANELVADTVPAYDANMLLIEGLMRDAPEAAAGLRDYMQAKLRYESPARDALAAARHVIARLKTVRSRSATDYEGADLRKHLGAMRQHLHKLLRDAERATPADKGLWDRALDGVTAVDKAVGGLVVAVQEIGRTARELGMWGLDELANALGSSIDWTAASSIGTAYQAGKSTGEIFTVLVDGIIGRWRQAIEHAGNGDCSLLVDLDAELALDLAIAVATAGAATGGVAAPRVETGARTAAHSGARAIELTQDAAEALARRAEDVIAKIRATAASTLGKVRDALRDSLDAATGLSDALRHALEQADAGVGSKVAVLAPGEIPEAIRHARGARAFSDARAAISKLRDPAARKQGQRVMDALEELARRSAREPEDGDGDDDGGRDPRGRAVARAEGRRPRAQASRTSSQSTPMSGKVFPGDTQWAIAGQIAAPVLVKLGRRLPEWLHGDGHKVVTGKDGFAAMLVFGGAAELGDELAAELAQRGKVYLLDFDDEAYSIKELTGARVKRLRGYPNEFLEERGIIAPGWEPSPPSPMIEAGVVEGITAEEARRAYPDAVARFAEHPRGVLVFGAAATSIAVDLSIRRKLRSYAVFFNRDDGDFFCTVRQPDGTRGCFALGEPSPNYPQLDSILGETTMDGILRVLEIPRELFPVAPE